MVLNFVNNCVTDSKYGSGIFVSGDNTKIVLKKVMNANIDQKEMNCLDEYQNIILRNTLYDIESKYDGILIVR